MNSLLITDTYVPRIGGRENYYHNLFSRFPADQVVVVTPDLIGDYQSFDRDYNLPILRISDISRKWFAWGRPGRFKWLREIGGICWKYNIDVVHCGLAIPDGLSGWFLQKTLGIPYIVYTHGKEILEYCQHPKWSKYLDVVLASASRVVCNSNYTGEILKQVGVPEEKIVRICPGVDVSHWIVEPDSARVQALQKLHELENRPVILTVTRLIERKGCDQVIEAMPNILSRFPEAVYLIVGEGPERDRLETLRNQLGLTKSVIFAGAVSDQDLRAYYSLANLFAMISRQPPGSHEVEGFGIVYLEANACGLPVVAGNSGGVPDAVVDGKTGYLVDPFSSEAVASAILRLLENPELGQEMGYFGRERAAKEFSWSEISDRLQQLTQTVAAEMPKYTLLNAATQTLPFMLQRPLFKEGEAKT